jgi:hypothetical protein
MQVVATIEWLHATPARVTSDEVYTRLRQAISSLHETNVSAVEIWVRLAQAAMMHGQHSCAAEAAAESLSNIQELIEINSATQKSMCPLTAVNTAMAGPHTHCSPARLRWARRRCPERKPVAIVHMQVQIANSGLHVVTCVQAGVLDVQPGTRMAPPLPLLLIQV